MSQLVRFEGNLLYKQNCTVVHFEMILAMKTQNIYRTIVFDNSLTCLSHVWRFLGFNRLTHEHGRVDSHYFSLLLPLHPHQYIYTLTMYGEGGLRWDEMIVIVLKSNQVPHVGIYGDRQMACRRKKHNPYWSGGFLFETKPDLRLVSNGYLPVSLSLPRATWVGCQ